MMDNEIPKVRWLRPGATIVYSNSLVGLRIQYCLQAGAYTGRVAYFDAMPLSGDTYSPPVHSNRFRFVVSCKRGAVIEAEKKQREAKEAKGDGGN
jgi:hypothetical protein